MYIPAAVAAGVSWSLLSKDSLVRKYIRNIVVTSLPAVPMLTVAASPKAAPTLIPGMSLG